MAYEIELHYGFERSHDTYETYHAFEATDIEEEADDAAIEAKLADLPTAARTTRTSTANPCASHCLREQWSASERRAMRPVESSYWPR